MEEECDCMTKERLSVPSQLIELCAMVLCDYMWWSKEVHSKMIFKIEWIV